jgi:hypothetical protein
VCVCVHAGQTQICKYITLSSAASRLETEKKSRSQADSYFIV